MLTIEIGTQEIPLLACLLDGLLSAYNPKSKCPSDLKADTLVDSGGLTVAAMFPLGFSSCAAAASLHPFQAILPQLPYASP